ncbi:hypothetical protein B0H63DRAFT_175116 [Podospora didyma]|uniref:Uncharacterized protein n=1 Tax=Podospora didyma TaxID=330526 RepID=A0AAE0NP29_9PEZI|nr:hypothetical protein B0H63DRAFT_175116 [Podospora didyma]
MTRSLTYESSRWVVGFLSFFFFLSPSLASFFFSFFFWGTTGCGIRIDACRSASRQPVAKQWALSPREVRRVKWPLMSKGMHRAILESQHLAIRLCGRGTVELR